MPKPGWLAIFALAGILAGGVGGWFMGYAKGRQAARVEAVKTNHARYRVIDEFGNTEFEWLGEAPHPPAAK